MKKTISIFLFIVLLFSFAGCSGENKSEKEVATTKASTTTPETTTKVSMSEQEAFEIIKYRLDLEDGILISDELWDEYGLIADGYNIEYLPFPDTNYNEATETWSFEIMGSCDVKEFGTGRYLGEYAFVIYATVEKDGKNSAFVKTIAEM